MASCPIWLPGSVVRLSIRDPLMPGKQCELQPNERQAWRGDTRPSPAVDNLRPAAALYPSNWVVAHVVTDTFHQERCNCRFRQKARRNLSLLRATIKPVQQLRTQSRPTPFRPSCLTGESSSSPIHTIRVCDQRLQEQHMSSFQSSPSPALGKLYSFLPSRRWSRTSGRWPEHPRLHQSVQIRKVKACHLFLRPQPS